MLSDTECAEDLAGKGGAPTGAGLTDRASSCPPSARTGSRNSWAAMKKDAPRHLSPGDHMQAGAVCVRVRLPRGAHGA